MNTKDLLSKHQEQEKLTIKKPRHSREVFLIVFHHMLTNILLIIKLDARENHSQLFEYDLQSIGCQLDRASTKYGQMPIFNNGRRLQLDIRLLVPDSAWISRKAHIEQFPAVGVWFLRAVRVALDGQIA